MASVYKKKKNSSSIGPIFQGTVAWLVYYGFWRRGRLHGGDLLANTSDESCLAMPPLHDPDGGVCMYGPVSYLKY